MLDIISVVMTSFVGVLGLSAAVEGYFKREIIHWQRVVLAIGSLALILPEWTTDIVGFALVAIVAALNLKAK